MRIEKSVTSITWIPSEAISGMPKVPFELGITYYDDPPPDRIGDVVAEIGPGALLCERALLEGGKRTATLWAATPLRVAVIPPDAIDDSALPELAAAHRREET